MNVLKELIDVMSIVTTLMEATPADVWDLAIDFIVMATLVKVSDLLLEDYRIKQSAEEAL